MSTASMHSCSIGAGHTSGRFVNRPQHGGIAHGSCICLSSSDVVLHAMPQCLAIAGESNSVQVRVPDNRSTSSSLTSNLHFHSIAKQDSNDRQKRYFPRRSNHGLSLVIGSHFLTSPRPSASHVTTRERRESGHGCLWRPYSTN